MDGTNKTIANKTRNTITQGYRTSRNVAQQGYNRFRALGTLTQGLIVLVVIILVILIILYIYHLVKQAEYRSRQSPYLLTKPVNAFNRSGRAIKRVRVPNPVDGLAYSYSFWMYVANWNYRFGNWKNILLKGNNRVRSPGIWLYPKSNSLNCRISTYPDLNEGCDIQNIPLQKWVHVSYILNNRTVDIYINGKLERSCVLRGVPMMNSSPVTIANNGGFWGQLAKMQYFTRALEPSEVARIYSEGPYVSGNFTILGGGGDNGDNGNNGDTCPENGDLDNEGDDMNWME